MFDKRVMVIRTDPDEKGWIWSELQCGRLRQGWGITNLQLEENGETVPSDVWEERYSNSVWGKKGRSDRVKKRYCILRRMTDLNLGDIVVVPNIPSWDRFTITKVEGRYFFDRKRGAEDYGHVIPVETYSVKAFPYSSSIEARLITKKLRGYQSAVNNVWDSKFIESVVKLFHSETVPTEKHVSDIFNDIKEKSLGDALDKIRELPYGDLEKLVQIAFENAGYECVDKHSYDRKGGDADLVFQHPLPLVSDFLGGNLTVFVQVKQKSGKDWNDTEGVDQLARISADRPQSVKVLVSTADEFSKECIELAQEEQVILVPALQTAEVLMKYL